MQVLKGTKREITLMLWNEQLQKAEKKLAESRECQKRFGDHEDWVRKDEQKVEEIKQNMQEVVEYMNKHNIR